VDTDLIISAGTNEVTIALLRDKRLEELHKEPIDLQWNVGDLYLGRVKRTVQGLNAAFIDVGYEKDAFLHYHDLGPQVETLKRYIKRVKSGKQGWELANFNFEKDIDKNGKIDAVMKPGTDMVVQIAKEPISTKGPRLSSELSIAGRYLVLIPFSNRISISSKIREKAERSRLKRLIESIRPQGFGVIVRTVAQQKKVADLHNDLNHLVQKWKKMVRNLERKKSPSRVLDEIDRATSVLRDLMNETFNSIVVDDEQLFEDIKAYIENIAPGREKILRLHEGQLPLLEQYGVERQIKSSFGRSVSMSKGAYLVIEHTEACHVIDVNSGNRSNKDGNQEENALEVNLIAAKEVARQLKLRDMGGIVVVDFIDMQRRENRKKLFDELRSYMAEDRAKHKILPPSKFGLVEITRQRVRPVLNIQTREENPSGGGGKIDAPILIIDKIESKIQTLIERNIKGKVSLHLHPFIAAYVKQGWRSPRFNWFMKYKRWIQVIPRDAFNYMQYAFVDSNGDEIDL